MGTELLKKFVIPIPNCSHCQEEWLRIKRAHHGCPVPLTWKHEYFDFRLCGMRKYCHNSTSGKFASVEKFCKMWNFIGNRIDKSYQNFSAQAFLFSKLHVESCSGFYPLFVIKYWNQTKVSSFILRMIHFIKFFNMHLSVQESKLEKELLTDLIIGSQKPLHMVHTSGGSMISCCRKNSIDHLEDSFEKQQGICQFSDVAKSRALHLPLILLKIFKFILLKNYADCVNILST